METKETVVLQKRVPSAIDADTNAVGEYAWEDYGRDTEATVRAFIQRQAEPSQWRGVDWIDKGRVVVTARDWVPVNSVPSIDVSITLRDPNHDGTLPVKFVYVVVKVARQEDIVRTLDEAKRYARRLGMTPIGAELKEAW